MLPCHANRRRPSYQPIVLYFVALGVLGLAGCDTSTVDPAPAGSGLPAEDVPHHPVLIRTPSGPPRVLTGTTDEHGKPVSIACATCHTTLPTNTDAKVGKQLVLFHQGMVGNHGNLSCTACHNPTDGYDSLRLADGTKVGYSEVMTLCAQCHGTQYRDYQHGAHGGMTGYWDLTKGGRVRNNCIDCHDPHSPKYPTVAPASGPNDRFQTGGGHE